MNEMIGKKIMISGMTIEIVSDVDEKWEVRNITTNETMFMDKQMIQRAIKLGKAEEISELEDNG